MMPTWRKVLLGVIVAALIVVAIVFEGTIASALCILILIQIPGVYAFTHYVDMDMGQLFNNGKNTEGWK